MLKVVKLNNKHAAHLKNMLDNGIRSTKQVDTRDAAHLRLHSAWRQVLLPQTWNQHSANRMQGRSHIHVTQGTMTVQGGGTKHVKKKKIIKMIKYEAISQEKRGSREEL